MERFALFMLIVLVLWNVLCVAAALRKTQGWAAPQRPGPNFRLQMTSGRTNWIV